MDEEIDPGDVAAWPVEAGDEAEFRPGRRRPPKTIGIVAVAALAARAAGVKPGVAMTVDAAADQVGHQSRHPVVLAFQPVIFDRDVASLDAARFAQALPECRSVPDRPRRPPRR